MFFFFAVDLLKKLPSFPVAHYARFFDNFTVKCQGFFFSLNA